MKENSNLISHKNDKNKLGTIGLSLFTLSIIYIIWWVDLISESAKINNIYGDDSYLLWIPFAIIVWIAGVILLWRLTAKRFGDFYVGATKQSLIIKYRLIGFRFSKKYDYTKICKLRIIDKGNHIFQVGFNYGDNEDYIGISSGYPEEKANEIFNEFKKVISE